MTDKNEVVGQQRESINLKRAKNYGRVEVHVLEAHLGSEED